MLSLPFDYWIFDFLLKEVNMTFLICKGAIVVCTVTIHCNINYQQVPDVCSTNNCPVLNG